jgi:short-subunit dehydrogenase
MAETILVTGATGTVGREVVRQIASVDSKVNIKAAGHSLQGLEKIIEDDRIKSTQIDFNEPETLRTMRTRNICQIAIMKQQMSVKVHLLARTR